MRTYGHPRPGIRYVQRPGVYAIVALGPWLLVTEQADPNPELQLPGGGIDPGESPLQALHREVREETGWRIAPVRRLGGFIRHCWMPDYGIHARKVCHIHLARPIRPLGPPTEPGHRAMWLHVQDAGLLGVQGDRTMVRAWAGQHGEPTARHAG